MHVVGAQYIAPALTLNQIIVILHPDMGAIYCAHTDTQLFAVKLSAEWIQNLTSVDCVEPNHTPKGNL